MRLYLSGFTLCTSCLNARSIKNEPFSLKCPWCSSFSTSKHLNTTEWKNRFPTRKLPPSHVTWTTERYRTLVCNSQMFSHTCSYRWTQACRVPERRHREVWTPAAWWRQTSSSSSSSRKKTVCLLSVFTELVEGHLLFWGHFLFSDHPWVWQQTVKLLHCLSHVV